MKEHKPAYLELYETLREEIRRGDRAAGERLTSRRQLARDYGLSVVTGEHSLVVGRREGYNEARPRSGYYIIYQAEDGFAVSVPPEAEPRGAPVPGGERTFPFSVLARTMRRVLTDYGEALMSKPPNQGCEELRRAISRYLGRNRGMQVRPECIYVGAGAEYLYGLVVEALGADRVFAIESPSYEKIEQVYRARGVTCELLPLGRNGIQSAALRRTRATVLHITPYRSFPSGVTATASKRAEYLKWAEAGDRFVVEDDFESEFSLLRKPEETVFTAAEKDNVIYLNTFSRTISPSLRIGYMVIPESRLDAFRAKIGFYSCTVPAFEQYVLASLVDSGDFERHINRIRREERRKTQEEIRQCT